MNRARVVSGWLAKALIVAALAMLSVREVPAQDADPAKKPSPAKPADVAPGKKARAGQLPPYYGEVVDDAQRQTIYAIQAEFNAQIKALQAKLDALKKERDDKIEAVLTPEQRKQVNDLRAAAKAKRDTKKPAKEKALRTPPKVSPPKAEKPT
jgi:Spy/CpxP family protein refolding chaperone